MRVRWGPRSRSGLGEIISFRGLNASFFVIFFFNRPRISRGVHFSALKCPEMKCKGRTERTTASTTMRMNTEGILHSPSCTLLHVRGTLKDLYYAWRVCRHHGTIGRTITEFRGWVGGRIDKTMCKYGLYMQYDV